MARTARDGMTGRAGGSESVKDSDTVVAAARRLAELNVGALAVCGGNGRLEGILLDRDIVVNVVAAGKDPATTTVAQAVALDAAEVVEVTVREP
jgi:CBS domain-containing protein